MSAAAKQPRPGFMGRGPLFWVTSMLVSLFAILFLAGSDAINGPTALILMLVPAAHLYPLMRAGQACEEAKGYSSPAVKRYNRDVLIAAIAYLLGMGVAVWLDRSYTLGPAFRWAVAALPAVPLLAMIAVMGRYIVEETDEFLRQRATLAAMGGLGVLLSVASVWGILAEFDLVPQSEGWMAVPVWALGMGATFFILRGRDS